MRLVDLRDNHWAKWYAAMSDMSCIRFSLQYSISLAELKRVILK